MKRILLVVVIPVLACVNVFSQNSDSVRAQEGMEVRALNTNAFNPYFTVSPFAGELNSLVPQEFQGHPEFGAIPFNSGLDSAIELIDQRTEYTRTLVKAGTSGKITYTQKGYYPLHYRDTSGQWMTYDSRLHPVPNQQGVFEAVHQYSPTTVNTVNKSASIRNGASAIRFNNNLELFYQDSAGNRTSLGIADWSNYSAGSDGVLVVDAWNGIDMQILVSDGAIKTNYIVKSPVLYTSGFFVFVDNIDAGTGSTMLFTSPNLDLWGNTISSIDVIDNGGNHSFRIGEAWGYDQSNNRAQNTAFGYRLVGSDLELHVPVSWLSNPIMQYPLIIDPLVSSTGTRLQGSIGGSGLNNSGAFTNSCNYTLAVPTPTNCTITNVLWSFTYRAQNGAVMCEGGLDFLYGACRSPAAAGFYWFCNNCTFAGNCTGTNVSIFGDFAACIPAPQCASYNMNFTMRFYDRWAGAACSNTFIAANSNWVMTIEGQTVNQPSAPASSNGTTICLGAFTTLTASGTFGVPGYTYLWSPGGQTTQSITVAPTTTTTYTCTITDACGVTAVNQVTITVNTANTLIPAPTFSISLSPASGNPCPVTATVTYTGASSYAGGAEQYQWSFGGASSIAGGSTSGSANSPPYGGPYTVTYNTPGSYALSVTIISGGQCGVTTQAITICGVLPVEVLNFDGSHVGNGTVELHWSSASETNNSHFVIERSYDGVTFEHVGNVSSKAPNGNSSQRLDYQIMDEVGVKHSVIYYRLKQFDFNGASEIVGNVSVQIDPLRGSVQIVPNPVNNTCTITWNSVSNQQYVMSIIDATGAVVRERTYAGMDGSTRVEIDLSDLPTGLYMTRISDAGGKVFVSKLLIQKSK